MTITRSKLRDKVATVLDTSRGSNTFQQRADMVLDLIEGEGIAVPKLPWKRPAFTNVLTSTSDRGGVYNERRITVEYRRSGGSWQNALDDAKALAKHLNDTNFTL